MIRLHSKLTVSAFALAVASGKTRSVDADDPAIQGATFTHASGEVGDTKVQSLDVATNGSTVLLKDDTGNITGFNTADLAIAGKMLIDSISTGLADLSAGTGTDNVG